MKHFDEGMFQMGWFKPPSSHEIQIITSFHDFVRTPRVQNRLMTKCHSVHFFLKHKNAHPWLVEIHSKILQPCLTVELFYNPKQHPWNFHVFIGKNPFAEVTEVTRPCLDREWRKTCDLADSVEGGWMESEVLHFGGGIKLDASPGCLGSIVDEILPSLNGDYFISHEIRIPLKQSVQWKVGGFFFIVHLMPNLYAKFGPGFSSDSSWDLVVFFLGVVVFFFWDSIACQIAFLKLHHIWVGRCLENFGFQASKAQQI